MMNMYVITAFSFMFLVLPIERLYLRCMISQREEKPEHKDNKAK